jgi:hypothetical protein
MTLSNHHLFRNSSTHTKDTATTNLLQMSSTWKICWADRRNQMKLLIPISTKLSRTIPVMHNIYSQMTILLMLPKAKGKHLNPKSSFRMSQCWPRIIAKPLIQPAPGGRRSYRFRPLLTGQDLVIWNNFLQQSNWMLLQI